MMSASRSIVSSNILFLQIWIPTCEYWIQIFFFSPCTVAKVYPKSSLGAGSFTDKWSKFIIKFIKTDFRKIYGSWVKVRFSKIFFKFFEKFFWKKFFWKFSKKKIFWKNSRVTHQNEAENVLNRMVVKWSRSDVMVVLESSFCIFLKNRVGWCGGVMWPLILKRRIFWVDCSLKRITWWHERAISKILLNL